MNIKTLGLCLIAAAFSACASTGHVLDTQTHANAKNSTAQHVPPTDEQKANTYIPHDAERRRLSREAYRENTVPTARSQSTQ